MECGNNARDSILRHCKDGNVIVRDNGYDFGVMPNDEIDICLDGCRFRMECGNNARDSILRHCKDGNVIVRDNGYDFGVMPNDEIDICLDGCRFRTGDRIYTYMEGQRGFPN